jgi:hypothetical protein
MSSWRYIIPIGAACLFFGSKILINTTNDPKQPSRSSTYIRPVPEKRKEVHRQVLAQYNHWVSVRREPLLWAQTMFAETGSFINANSLPAIGHQDIAQGAAKIYDLADNVNMTTIDIHHVSENVFISESEVVYTMKDGRVLDPLRIMAKWTLEVGGSLIKQYRSFIDKTPMLIAAGLDITADELGNPKLVRRNHVEGLAENVTVVQAETAATCGPRND